MATAKKKTPATGSPKAAAKKPADKKPAAPKAPVNKREPTTGELAESLASVVEQTNANMEDLDSKISSITMEQASTSDKLDRMMAMMEERHEKNAARNAGVSPGKVFEAGSANLGGNRVIRDEDLDNRTNPEIEIEGVDFLNKAAALAFMEEMVVVRVNPDNNPHSDKRVPVMVNGRMWVLTRGKKYEVPRKVVEGLARAKPVHFANVKVQNADGDDEYEWPQEAGLRYPFEVMEDKNPMGRRWLESVLAQP
jgi:hypothetical protein